MAEPANPARERRPGRADVHEPNAETEKTAGGADARAAWMSAGDARNKTHNRRGSASSNQLGVAPGARIIRPQR